MLQVCLELVRKGFDVYKYRAEERLNREAVLSWLMRSGRTILVFDGLADHVEAVEELAQVAVENKVPLLILGSERERRKPLMEASIAPEHLVANDSTRMGRLSDQDIKRLITRLASATRLGKITRLSNAAKESHFSVESSRRLFVGMATLEGGTGFISRVRREYSQDISSSEMRKVYGLVCLAHSLGYHVSLGVTSTASGVAPSEIVRSIAEGQLFRTVLIDEQGLKSRHRVLASMVVEQVMTHVDKFNLSLALVKALAPHMNPETIRQQTSAYLVVRRLMDQEVVRQYVGNDLTKRWYEELEPAYKWNARFWEQRALAEIELGAYGKARSFAEYALKQQRHPFTLNTLGTILLRTAVENQLAGSPEAENMFWEGVQYLKESRDSREWQRLYPHVTFFTYALKFAERHYHGRHVAVRLVTEWNEWMNTQRWHGSGLSSADLDSMNMFQGSWAKLLVAANEKGAK